MANLKENIDALDFDKHFLNLAKTDALNSIRTNDTIKEKLTGSLLSKVDNMEPKEILDCIDRLDGSKVIASYQSLCKMFTK